MESMHGMSRYGGPARIRAARREFWRPGKARLLPLFFHQTIAETRAREERLLLSVEEVRRLYGACRTKRDLRPYKDRFVADVR